MRVIHRTAHDGAIGPRLGCSLLLAAALLTGSVAVSAPAADAGSSSLAESAKKKCKKKKKKKNGKGSAAAKKCRKKKPAIPPATPAPASLSIDPTSHSFGTLVVGNNESKVFTVTNGGGSASGALASSIPTTPQSDAFSISEDTCAGTALAASASCTLKVTFTAPFGGRSATLNVSGAPGGNPSAVLSGSGSL